MVEFILAALVFALGIVIGKGLGIIETLTALELHECDVKIARARKERVKLERRIQRLERKQLRFKKEDVAP